MLTDKSIPEADGAPAGGVQATKSSVAITEYKDELEAVIAETNTPIAQMQEDQVLYVDKTDGTIKSCTAHEFCGKGWAVYFDGTHIDIGSAYTVADNESKLLPCDGTGGATVTSELPAGVTALWDVISDKIIGNNIGDGFDVRIEFDAQTDNQNGAFDIHFDIGNPTGIIISGRTLTFPKGSGAETHFSVGLPLYSMATFVANGCKVRIDGIAGKGTTSIYNISVFVKRDYKGKGV